jgi:hypothetical protein
MATLKMENVIKKSDPQKSPQAKEQKSKERSFPILKRRSFTATERWVNYVLQLDPDDQRGAFLTPEDLQAIDIAYMRLQSSDGGIPNSPSNQTRLASNADDEFIKRKIAIALERAHILAMKRQPDFTVLKAGQRKFVSVKVLEYQRGVTSGKCLVLLPQGKTIEKNFNKENMWKAKVEFFDGDKRKTQTLYARGLCMNAIAGEARRQFKKDSTYDYSGIQFKPLGKLKKNPSLYPVSDSLDYPDPMEAPVEEGFLTKLSKFLGT